MYVHMYIYIYIHISMYVLYNVNLYQGWQNSFFTVPPTPKS